MKLNEFGQIAHNEWIKTPQIRPNIELHEFVVMPNHIHGIIQIHHAARRGVLNTPPIADQSNTQQINTPPITDQSNTPQINTPQENPNPRRGVLNTPHMKTPPMNASKKQGVCNTQEKQGVCNTHEKQGVCNTHEKQGVCNTPLRLPSQTIGAIVRGYKSAVTKQLNLIGFAGIPWQRNYYEHIIRDEQSHLRIVQYIIENPAKWQDDSFCKDEHHQLGFL